MESPEQIGRVERRNATLKYMLQTVIKETSAFGREQGDMALTEGVTAMNEMSHLLSRANFDRKLEKHL